MTIRKVVELIAVARAGEEIREICRLTRAGIAGAAAVLTESLAESLATIDRIEIIDLSVDGQVLPAVLHAVPALDERVVDLGIDHEWILELRIRRLRAPGGEVLHALIAEPANHSLVRRQAGNTSLRIQALLASEVWIFAAMRPGKADSCIERRVGAERVCNAGRDLSIVSVNGAIAAVSGVPGIEVASTISPL